MKKSAFNLLLVALSEAVSAVAAYLNERLMGNIRRTGDVDHCNRDLPVTRQTSCLPVSLCCRQGGNQAHAAKGPTAYLGYHAAVSLSAGHDACDGSCWPLR